MEGSGLLRRTAIPMQPVEDPAEWTGVELAASDDWIFDLTESDVAELEAAVDGIDARGLDLLHVGVDEFPLGALEDKLSRVKAQVIDGRGLALVRGLPVERLGPEVTAKAFWGMGLRVGAPVSQNAMGHMMGHVTDLVGKDLNNPKNRGYQTSAELHFHGDSCDVVALLCRNEAKSGGVTKFVSSAAIHNEMLRRRPDLVEQLAGPWCRDRREEVPDGKNPWFVMPVFNYIDGHLVVAWQGTYIRSAQRFDGVPKFTDLQNEVLTMLSDLAEELCHGIQLRRGDTVFTHNHVILHARTEFEDYDEADRRRHLFRLWLATPDGRPIPEELLERYVGLEPGQRPSGVIVKDTTLCAPLMPVSG
jgi:hypothetical protein